MRLVVCTCQNTSVTLKGSYDIDLPLAVTPGQVRVVHPYSTRFSSPGRATYDDNTWSTKSRIRGHNSCRLSSEKG